MVHPPPRQQTGQSLRRWRHRRGAGALSGAVVILTREAVNDWITAAIAVVTLGLLWRFKINEPYIVIAAGTLGILLH